MSGALDGLGPEELLAVAFNSRAAALRGEYCECDHPILVGAALMCGRCLRRNKSQEIASVIRIVEAHDFEPHPELSAELSRHFCGRCMSPSFDPRHDGNHGVGKTSWGEEIRP